MTSRQRPYEIEWGGPARRSVSKLPDKVAVAAVEFIYGPLAENPQRVGKQLRFELEGRHSAYPGDYRIVYRIDVHERIVFILAIAHRADIYRRR